MVSPTINVPLISVKNNSTITKAPETKFSTRSTIAVEPVVFPVIVRDSNLSFVSLVIILNA